VICIIRLSVAIRIRGHSVRLPGLKRKARRDGTRSKKLLRVVITMLRLTLRNLFKAAVRLIRRTAANVLSEGPYGRPVLSGEKFTIKGQRGPERIPV